MNIEQRLDRQAKLAKDHYNEFLTDPNRFLEDQEAFQQAYQVNAVSHWAVLKKLESSHQVAKRIIDSI